MAGLGLTLGLGLNVGGSPAFAPAWLLAGSPALQGNFADRNGFWLNGTVYSTEAAIKALFGTFSTPSHIATDTDGILRAVAANSLDAFTVPDGKCRGQLIEGAATSLAVYSRTLDPLAWTLTNMTRSAAAGADGQAGTAIQLTATANNATAIAPAVTSASAARRFAPYLRRISGTGNVDVTFNNGSTWTTLSAPTGSYTRIGAGATVTNPQVGIRLATSGDVILVDFANGETGAVDTSPIATTSANVTRATTSIIMEMPSGLATGLSAAGSMAAFGEPSVTLAGLTRTIAEIYSSSTSRQTVDERPGFGFGAFWQSGGVTQANITGGSPTLDTLGRVASSWGANDFRFYTNGSQQTPDTSGTVPTVTHLGVGDTIAASRIYNGYVHTIALYTTALSNALLAEVTT